MADQPQNMEETPKFDPGRRPEPDNEQRYIALLALTSQELPATDQGAQQGQEALFDRLDADPAALEGYIGRERRGSKTNVRGAESGPTLLDRLREWFTVPSVRYAAAFGIAALVSLTLVLQFTRGGGLVDDVERTYAGIVLKPTQAALILPWERPREALGFSANGESSPASIDYARGLLRGKQRLLAAPSDTASAESADKIMSDIAALGEWNVLLWAASESTTPQSTEFWRSQSAVQRLLAAGSYDSESRAAISAHLDRVAVHLDILSSGQNSLRSARRLADELLLFREQFAPHDPSLLNGDVSLRQ